MSNPRARGFVIVTDRPVSLGLIWFFEYRVVLKHDTLLGMVEMGGGCATHTPNQNAKFEPKPNCYWNHRWSQHVADIQYTHTRANRRVGGRWSHRSGFCLVLAGASSRDGSRRIRAGGTVVRKLELFFVCMFHFQFPHTDVFNRRSGYSFPRLSCDEGFF